MLTGVENKTVKTDTYHQTWYLHLLKHKPIDFSHGNFFFCQLCWILSLSGLCPVQVNQTFCTYTKGIERIFWVSWKMQSKHTAPSGRFRYVLYVCGVNRRAGKRVSTWVIRQKVIMIIMIANKRNIPRSTECKDLRPFKTETRTTRNPAETFLI